MSVSTVPDWLWKLPLRQINKKADEFNLDRALVAAIVKVESAGQARSMRFEPGWQYPPVNHRAFASNLGITEQTEAVLQKCSFGLMQVMGAVARELGFTGHLIDLCEPETGLHYGCMKLKKLFERYGSYEPDVIAGYNAGSAIKEPSGMYRNQSYVNKVDQALRELRELK